MAVSFYAGEVIEVVATATDMDGTTQLVPATVSRVTVEIASNTTPPVIEVPETAMSWNTGGFWYYEWITPSSLPQGLYTAKVTIYALDTTKNFDFQQFFLLQPAF